MNNELIARFNTPSIKLTGNHETTSLIDLETGLGNFIASRFSGLVVTDKTAPRNKGVLAFLEKELAQRVVCGEFNDPQSILSAISAKKHDSNTLPVVNVAMPVSFAFADGEAYRDIELCGDLHNKMARQSQWCTKCLCAVPRASPSWLRINQQSYIWPPTWPLRFAYTAHMGAPVSLRRPSYSICLSHCMERSSHRKACRSTR